MNPDILFKKLNDTLIEQNRSSEDISKIKEAFQFAKDLHEGQYRVSEEPYIIHPIEVACILANILSDRDSIIAALLHDILEDTDTKPEEIREKFGDEVLNLVNGVTKLSKFSFNSKEERQAENFRKMFLAMADDIRVIFLKLADRLHNMRTLNYMKLEKQKKIAQETLEVFAPLANRLGMGKIKVELEDLSLRYTNPEKYYEIAQLVAQNKTERDSTVSAIMGKIQSNLVSLGIKATITGRAKHYFSIYNKMVRQHKSYQDLYDITAVRVIVDSEKECYEVLGVIHSSFKPIPGRFKDYIAMPKSNLYRSLHTSVIGPRGKPIEVQIRTTEMHEIAENGIAAHWKYKESGSVKAEKGTDEQLAWLRKLVELQQDATDAKEFVNSVKIDLFSDEVFVFSPQGDVIDLPQGATPIDFAYRIHTEVGHRCTGALVSGRIVPLDTKLKTGDIVEVLTAKNPQPKADWINLVVTNQAKSKIKLWFKKNNRDTYIAQGRSHLEEELTKSVFDEYLKEGKILEVSKQLNYHSEDDLFAALGGGEVTLHRLLNKLKPEKEEGIVLRTVRSGSRKSNKQIVGLEGMLYHISKCCSPVPGEPIVGVVTRSRGVSVHRQDCKTLEKANPERFLEINWPARENNKIYVTNIKIEAIDRMGVFKDILGKIADHKTNMTSANVSSKNKQIATIDIGLEIFDINHLNTIINSISSLPDTISVSRH